MYICQVCKIDLEENETYEYRGAYSCATHFDEVTKNRDAAIGGNGTGISQSEFWVIDDADGMPDKIQEA